MDSKCSSSGRPQSFALPSASVFFAIPKMMPKHPPFTGDRYTERSSCDVSRYVKEEMVASASYHQNAKRQASTPPLLVPRSSLLIKPSGQHQNLQIDYHLSCVDSVMLCNPYKHSTGTMHILEGTRNNRLGILMHQADKTPDKQNAHVRQSVGSTW